MQTDSKLLTTCSAQTINAAMYSSGVQTDEPVVADLVFVSGDADCSKLLTTCSAQTINAAMYSSGVQTDKPVVADLVFVIGDSDRQ